MGVPPSGYRAAESLSGGRCYLIPDYSVAVALPEATLGVWPKLGGYAPVICGLAA